MGLPLLMLLVSGLLTGTLSSGERLHDQGSIASAGKHHEGYLGSFDLHHVVKMLNNEIKSSQAAFNV